VYAGIGGTLTLLGWFLDVPRLTAWNGHGINMKANTAVCALASGVALVALALGGPRRLVRALASMTLAIGALTLLEHVTGLDVGIDTILFDEAPGAPGTAAPGRMGPPAASSFSILAVALWLAGGGLRMRRAASALALLPVAIAALGTVGYAFGASQLFAVARLTGIALQTATMIAALGVGLMAAIPEHGLVATLRRDDPGGVLLRRLIAPLTLLPIVLGFVRLVGEQAGLYDTAFGTAARTLIEAALVIGLTWWTAEGVSRQARAARDAETAMREATRHKDEAARRLAILAETSRAFSAASPQLARVTEAVGSQVAAVFGGSCSLSLVSASGDTLEPVYVFHEDDRIRGALEDMLRHTPLRIGEGVSGRVAQTGSAVLIADVEQRLPSLTKPEYADYLNRHPIRNLLIVPVRAAGTVIGVLGTARYEEGRPYTDADQALLEDIADRAALAVENARLYERERVSRQWAERAADHLRRLHNLTSALGRAATTEEVAVTVVDAGRAAVGAVASFAWLLSDDERTLHLMASRGFEGPRLDAFREIPFDADVPMCAAIRSGRPLMFGSLEEMESQFPALRRAAGPTPFRSWAALPLMVGGRGIGGVSLSFAEARSFTADDRELLEGMAAQASMAVERCRLFEAEKAARARAEQADRRKDEFLAMLGHELRNPLAPISTALQLMRLRQDGVALRERMIIERQVRHLERLVDDLLDVSRITRGQIELKRVPVEMADIVTKAIEQVEPMLEQRSHRLIISVPRDRLTVEGDAVRLAQVISNLLTNAAKYTEPGGEISVSASREGAVVVVRVRDSGVGISPELLPHVFDLFTQAPQTLARSQGGLGLGLAIVRRLVELHGGRVEAHSAGPGTGSEFVVTLPYSEGRAPSDVAREAPRPAGQGQASRRILVVDDNEDAGDTLAEALRDGGHDVRVATDGPGALAVAAEFGPDIVLLDIGLPVMDGYEVARRLRQRTDPRPPRLLALTGYGQEKDRARALAAGFDDHIVKPVNLDDLFARLDRLAPTLAQ
jgi:signal transduction histidine kinase/ActR/RegA family two-component response regulator